MVTEVSVDVFSYLDYRRLLADYYRTKKAERRGFSYRAFARRAGVASPNHLKRVIDGERNLSDRSAEQYSRAMGLSGEPADYFTALVRFNQADSRRERQIAYERIRSFRGYRQAQRIDARYADYHAHWYIPAVREMVLVPGFRAEPRWIAERMTPPITVTEAKGALDVLFGLSMIVEDTDGTVRQTDPVVSTGEQTAGLHITRYHQEMLDKAKDAIDEVPAAERYVASLTFAVRADGFARLQQRLARFRQELIAELAEEQDASQVLQLGVQLFPLTRREP